MSDTERLLTAAERAIRETGHRLPCTGCTCGASDAFKTARSEFYRFFRLVTALPLLLAIFLAGCGAFGPAPLVLDRGQAALAYADLKELHGALSTRLKSACVAKVLDAATCADAQRATERLAEVDAEFRRALADPKSAVNWETVSRALGIVLRLAGVAVGL